MHDFVRTYRHRVIRATTFDPITPDFGPFHLGFPHTAESWYSQVHQSDMSVELVTSGREACAIYFRHFFDHWAYAAPLLSAEISDVPITFLQGTGDPVVPSTVSVHVAKYHSNYTVEYVPDRGHYAMVEKPDLVVDRTRGVFV